MLWLWLMVFGFFFFLSIYILPAAFAVKFKKNNLVMFLMLRHRTSLREREWARNRRVQCELIDVPCLGFFGYRTPQFTSFPSPFESSVASCNIQLK